MLLQLTLSCKRCGSKLLSISFSFCLDFATFTKFLRHRTALMARKLSSKRISGISSMNSAPVSSNPQLLMVAFFKISFTFPSCIVRVVSLVYVPEQLCYSLFWPTEDLNKDGADSHTLKEKGGKTRDFNSFFPILADTLYVDWFAWVKDEEKKDLLLIPWEEEDFSTRSSAHSFILTDQFFTSHKIAETLPDPKARLTEPTAKPLLVYTDLDLVAKTLTSPNYKITEDRDKADIVWSRKHIRNFE